jgi:hypothetical protein
MDEKLDMVVEAAADDLCDHIDMEVDEGEWREGFYRRTRQLGATREIETELYAAARNLILIKAIKHLVAQLEVT